jgi:hypothetical protein
VDGPEPLDLVGHLLGGRPQPFAGGERTLMIASIRYLDRLVKRGDAWLCAERRLLVDWTETRRSTR